MHSTALDLEYPISKHFALHSGLAYEQRKVRINQPDWGGYYNNSYVSEYFGEQITAPLTLVCTPWIKRPLRPFVRAGLFQSFILNETVEDYGTNIINNTLKDGIERDGGLLGGLGCVFNEGPWALKLELRASASVRPLPANNFFFIEDGKIIPEVVKETFPVRTVLLLGGIQHTF
jgi:Outer membrane protein beta-barrel domain